MEIIIREFRASDIQAAIDIWNTVVIDGVAFPQEECLDKLTGIDFFQSQTYTGIAYNVEDSEIVGLYILHPNNIGRCGHICNASYAVKKDVRGKRVGEQLVTDCKCQAKAHGFRILQFNAVVRSNYTALHLYKKLGFHQLGVIPGGFRLDNGIYEDIIPHYCEL